MRVGERLAETFGGGAAYLRDFDRVDRRRLTPSPTGYAPELSRDFRGLRLWLPLMLHGAAAFRSSVREKWLLARRFHDEVRRLPGVEVVAAPQVSICAFRLSRRAGESLGDWNGRNAAWLAEVNRGSRVYLSSTTLPNGDGEDVATLRVCVLGARTHEEHVDECLSELRRALPDGLA